MHPLAYARGSVTLAESTRLLPSRDRQGAVSSEIPKTFKHPTPRRLPGTAVLQVLQALVTQLLGALVRPALAFPLHGEVAAVAGGLGKTEGFRHAHAENPAVVDLGILDVRDVVRAVEHGLDGFVVEIFVTFHHGVAEIRQAAQPRAVDGVDHPDQEEGIFGD